MIMERLDPSVENWDDTHRPVIPARDAGIQESLLVSKQTNFVNIESS
ncbi:MAG: hypothetical protein PG978_000930 [Wolbachia endosymbiont of Ctenocephalides felis wCfeF]|nr:MAG: hypothetical protein PG978_000930 [Wolbachia endosymbiont of Ctenocephalides felis wCfeF]